MTVQAVGFPRPRVRTLADQASVALLRAVMADDWCPEAAARELLCRVHGDRRLLRILRARVSRAMLARQTEIDARATATLEHALATPVDNTADDYTPIPSPRFA